MLLHERLRQLHLQIDIEVTDDHTGLVLTAYNLTDRRKALELIESEWQNVRVADEIRKPPVGFSTLPKRSRSHIGCNLL
jgi:hypothetical protein